MPERFSEVSKNIYRGGKPSSEDLSILANVFGVNRIISLDGYIGEEIAPYVKKYGMEHIVIPIGGLESIKALKFLRNNIVSLLTDNQPVYIHCRHGSDRTGTAIALYRIFNDNWNFNDAIREAKKFGFGNKVDFGTEGLYLNIIGGKPDSNGVEDDMVTQMRDWFNMGDVPPAFTPQQSFAPRFDVERASPEPPTAARQNRRQSIRDILENMSGDGESENVPEIGLYDNYGGVRGAGPVVNHQGFMNI